VRLRGGASRQDHPAWLLLLIQVAGLAATGCFVWSQSIHPRLAYQSGDLLVAQAFLYALLACMVAALITAILYVALFRSFQPDTLPRVLRTSATAVWFGPATILLAVLSPATLIAGILLVISATRLLYSEWRLLPGEELACLPTSLPDLFGSSATAPLAFRESAPSLALALALQGAVVSLMADSPLAAAVLSCLSVSLLTLLLLMAGLAQPEKQKTLPRSIFGLLLTILLAAGLTTAGAGFGADLAVSPGGPLASARAVLRNLFRPTAHDTPTASVYLQPVRANVGLSDAGYPGVILWPDVKPRTTILVAPLPAWLRHPGPPANTVPAVIPFSGEYWLFRSPYVRPPQNSYFRKASPLTLSFTSLDHVPLRMEAHQTLEHPIDLGCCSAIQIAISNGDHYPGTVVMELVLSEQSRSLVLGTAEVAAWPGSYLFGAAEPVPEVLNFPVPARTTFSEFDEITVRFHFHPVRSDRSARMAIEHFVLVPRS
jgi:hypothetical protein